MIKRFKCMNVPWRHNRWQHPMVFNVCANLAALRLLYSPMVVHPHPFLTEAWLALLADAAVDEYA